MRPGASVGLGPIRERTHRVTASVLLDLIQKAYDATNDIRFECGEACIGFRGTEDFSDFLADIEAVKTDYELPMGEYRIPTGRVHEGFLERWEELRPLVFAVFTKPGPITITGHSLGGAMAVFCAIEMQVRGWDVNLITYGCPRVGDSQFAQLLNKNLKAYVRYENWGDPIPRIPRILGWAHGGRQNRLGSMANLLRWPLIQHHFMSAYRAAQEAMK
jgi:predicted lipase